MAQTIRWLLDGNEEGQACHAIFFLFIIMKFPRIVTPVSQKTVIFPGAVRITSDRQFRLFILVWLQNSKKGKRFLPCGYEKGFLSLFFFLKIAVFNFEFNLSDAIARAI